MKYINKSGLPKSIEDAITKNTYDLSQSNQNIISVTTLISPPKPRYLAVRHWDDLEKDISDSIWLLLGSSVHSVMERISSKNRLIEERMYIDTNTWDIVDKKNLDAKKIYIAGKPDLYDTVENTVEDYKVTSVYTVMNGRSEWEEQLNCYAWLYRRLGFVVDKLRIVAILKDWSRTKAGREKDYPLTAAIPINIKLWSEAEQLKFLQDKLAFHMQFRTVPDDDIPPCTPKERWRTEEKWAVMKHGNKRAIKLFDDEKQAKGMAIACGIKDGGKYEVEHRVGEDIRCLHYCDVCNFCNYYKTTYKK